MTTFKSTERQIAAAREAVYRRLSNPEGFKDLAGNVPEDMKQRVGGIRIEGDKITLNAKPVGDISFRIAKGVENERIHLETESSPLPFGIDVVLREESAVSTNVHVEISIDLNPIIKSMFAKPLQEAAEKFADLIAVIPYA